MKRDSIWKKFEKSGSVLDYLEYACTCEEDVAGAANNMATNNVVMSCGTDAMSGSVNGMKDKADTAIMRVDM